MDVLVYLIPASLLLALGALAAFMWSLKSGQYDDMDGAAHRILMDDDDMPAPEPAPRDPTPRDPTSRDSGAGPDDTPLVTGEAGGRDRRR
ncbi:cbb3-type cytochrome oxidase assembly protein CcoS [Tistrella sp. BH-R2-4]|uniref:Cbb3-type cytochrome oxidase assembly protein CcoS n=1 Tax=Tistrella arctica TaxID=3133430 RepID=A0ABU9YSC2_9PROT